MVPVILLMLQQSDQDLDGKELIGKIKNISEFGIRALFSRPSDDLTTNTNLSGVVLELDGHKIFEGGCKIVDDKIEDKFLSVGIFLKSNFIPLEKKYSDVRWYCHYFGSRVREMVQKFFYSS